MKIMKNYWKLLGEWATGLRFRPLARHKLKLKEEVASAHKIFMANASHELRTPLSIIKANSEVALLAGNDLKAKDAALVMRSNIEEVDRMSKIIEDLDSLSYYSISASEIEYKSLDLSHLTQYLIEKTRAWAKNKSIEVNIETEPVDILANRAAIEEMLLNILKNSINYTNNGGHIDIQVYKKDRDAIIKIRDNGTGIEAEDLPHVFDPFYKSAEIKAYNKTNSGIGLAIVKKIVDRHKGSITIESWPNKGTLVSILLPAL